MQVKAIAMGFYGSLREVGEEFEIKDKQHLGSWMEPSDSKPKRAVKREPDEVVADSGALPDA